MIGANIRKISEEIPSGVKLVAVSKTKPPEAIMEAYEAGQRAFGENKVQEMVEKYQQLPADIEWHLIGHLQSNKVKYIAPFVHLVHAVDSLKLLEVINREAGKNNRVIHCLLQFHIAQEETKFGLSPEEGEQLLQREAFRSMNNVSIQGVMGMASFTDDEQQIRKEFRNLVAIFNQISSRLPSGQQPQFSILSFGMSGDYRIAIEEGSNMIRVGSSIFGGR